MPSRRARRPIGVRRHRRLMVRPHRLPGPITDRRLPGLTTARRLLAPRMGRHPAVRPAGRRLVPANIRDRLGARKARRPAARS